jgi:hypothetical protein
MNTNSASPRPQIRGRSRAFRSLLVATAAAFVLTGFIVPKADGTVVAYYNFEDSTIGTRPPTNVLDLTPDLIPGKTQSIDSMVVGDNPGGGVEENVSNLQILQSDGVTPATNVFAVTPGLSINATANDSDTPSNFALAFTRSANNSGEIIQFSVNTQFYANMSLSFGFSNNGNGFSTVELQYSLDGFATPGVSVGTATMSTGIQPPISFTLPAAVNGNFITPKIVTFRLIFTGGFSNGNDTQTVIDNILIDGTVLPEPATVWGGLLGVCALCWYQRRRLIGFLPLRRG